MRRAGPLAAAGALLALGACADPAPPVPPNPAAARERVLTVVPEETTTPPPVASPSALRTWPAPSPGRTVTATARAGSAKAGLDRFVAEVQRRLPAVVIDRRDEEVEALAEKACDSLAAGQSVTGVVREIGAEGVASGDARTLVSLARRTACPNRPKV